MSKFLQRLKDTESNKVMNIEKCGTCGTHLEHRIEGSVQGSFCPECHNCCVVTTYIPQIAQDIAQYKIYLLSADYNNKEQIKVISKIGRVNFLQARKMIQATRPLLFEGEAIEVDKARAILQGLPILYEIEPDFPY